MDPSNHEEHRPAPSPDAHKPEDTTPEDTIAQETATHPLVSGEASIAQSSQHTPEEPTQRLPSSDTPTVDQQPTAIPQQPDQTQPQSLIEQQLLNDAPTAASPYPSEIVPPPSMHTPAMDPYMQPTNTPPAGNWHEPTKIPPSGFSYPGAGNQPSPPPYNYGNYSNPPQPPYGYGNPPHYFQPQPAPPPKQPGRLAQPLPLWLLLGSCILIVFILIVLHLTGSDWAAGAMHASYAGFIVAAILLIALLIRTWNGMSSRLNPVRRKQYVLSISGIILILAYSGICQFLQPALHIEQAKVLENQHQWQLALNEYTSGGENIRTSEDMARTYTSWGLALNKEQRYTDALNKFNMVIDHTDSHAAADQVQQAQTGAINARLALAQQSLQAKDYGNASTTYSEILTLPYCNAACKQQAQSNDITARIALGKQSTQAKNYTDATTQYDGILHLSYCDSSCKQQVSSLDATAYYQLAESNLATKNYATAVSAFDNVLQNFSHAPEAKKLHGDMAKALSGQGQSTRANDCAGAIPIYQRLAKEYGDTSQGKQANNDLNAPQTVQGTFQNVESNTPFSQMGLTTGLKGGMSQDQIFNQWDNASQKTSIGANGKFTFTNVPQGDYDLIWYANDGTEEFVEFIYSETTQDPEYTAHVGPLCPVNVGNISNAQGLFS